jgi:hypothetical protein
VALMELCHTTGMSRLREIIVLAVSPEMEFGFGPPLDPVERLEQYRRRYVEERGSEIERFGMCVGMALNPPYAPVFGLIGMSFGKPLLYLSRAAMGHVFSRR